jgi:hypothetical protein
LGAQDDKGAAAFCGLKAIIDARKELKGDVLFCPVASHKLGGWGTRTLLKSGVRADYCINLEHSANTIGSVIVGSIRVRLHASTPGLFFRFTEEARRAYFNPVEQQALFMQKFGRSLTALEPGGWLTFTPHPQLPDFPMIRYDVISKEHVRPLLHLAAEPNVGLAAGQRRKHAHSWAKKIGSRLANRLRAFLLGNETRDSACGLKAFRREVFLRLPHFDNMHRFLPALVIREGLQVRHLDVIDRQRRHGMSKYGVIDRALAGMLDLIGVWWLIRRRLGAPQRRR